VHQRPLEAPRIAGLDIGIGVRRRRRVAGPGLGAPVGVQGQPIGPATRGPSRPARSSRRFGARGRVHAPKRSCVARAVPTVIGRPIDPTIGPGIIREVEGSRGSTSLCSPARRWPLAEGANSAWDGLAESGVGRFDAFQSRARCGVWGVDVSPNSPQFTPSASRRSSGLANRAPAKAFLIT